MRKLSDEDLVPLVLDGDEAAASELFGRHAEALGRRIHARLSLQVRSRHSVADILQDGFQAAWLSLRRFESRGEGSFRRWLTGIVDKKTIDALRQHFRRKERGMATLRVPDSILEIARFPSPSTEAADVELQARLIRCIEELPSSQRAAARLVIGKGLSYTEAAQRLDTTPDAARLRVTRARESLWKCVQKGLS